MLPLSASKSLRLVSSSCAGSSKTTILFRSILRRDIGTYAHTVLSAAQQRSGGRLVAISGRRLSPGCSGGGGALGILCRPSPFTVPSGLSGSPRYLTGWEQLERLVETKASPRKVKNKRPSPKAKKEKPSPKVKRGRPSPKAKEEETVWDQLEKMTEKKKPPPKVKKEETGWDELERMVGKKRSSSKVKNKMTSPRLKKKEPPPSVTEEEAGWDELERMVEIGKSSRRVKSEKTRPIVEKGNRPLSMEKEDPLPIVEKEKLSPWEPQPSASVMLISSSNQILMLHRVSTSSSFPSAHVFPGGNLSEFQDGTIPPPGDARRHEDSMPYRCLLTAEQIRHRLAAIREVFEETGILLARKAQNQDEYLKLPARQREEARMAVYNNEVRFVDWVNSVGGIVDIGNLIEFTRWITPKTAQKRFTTQMYVYMVPTSLEGGSDAGVATEEAIAISEEAALAEETMIPTPDRVEHVAAKFDDAAAWLAKQRAGEIMLFPPQCFLLTMLSQSLTGPMPTPKVTPPPAVVRRENMKLKSKPPPPLPLEREWHYRKQRARLLKFLGQIVTASEPTATPHPTALIPWPKKVICPVPIGLPRPDGRLLLALDSPGPELLDTGHGGDWERAVLAKFDGNVVRDVEVVLRQDLDEAESEARRKEARAEKRAEEAKERAELEKQRWGDWWEEEAEGQKNRVKKKAGTATTFKGKL